MTADPPPRTQWRIPPPHKAGTSGFLALGADLEPGTVLAAYRAGIFPMPIEDVQQPAWFSPDPRGVIPLHEHHVSRSLRRSARRFEVTWDRDFAAVVAGCADPRRPGGWISPAMQHSYVRLHALGWAHSI